MSLKNIEINYKNTSYFGRLSKGGLLFFVYHICYLRAIHFLARFGYKKEDCNELRSFKKYIESFWGESSREGLFAKSPSLV